KISSFLPNKQHLREALLFCFNLKKSAAEARRLLEEVYDEHTPSKTTCEDWFKRFRSGDFDTEDKERSGRPKTIEDADLQALLDEDDTQTQYQFAEALSMTRQGISKHL
ncbi:Histone-lysine N-methyltransferase SETMAR, partial [Harpegnathos saltator]